MSMLSKIILGVCFFCLPIMTLYAQDKNQNQEKYLVGAVPEVDGKVVFSELLHTKHSIDQIIKIIDQWIDEKENKKGSFFKARIIYNDSLKHEFAMSVEDRLVFSSNAFTLDFVMVSYYLIFSIENQKCDVTIKNIKYTYVNYKNNVTADEMITDKVALNKEKTKMVRTYNKFRIATVNMVDEIFDQLGASLNEEAFQDLKNTTRSRNNATEIKSTSTLNKTPSVIETNVPIVEEVVVASAVETIEQPIITSTKNKKILKVEEQLAELAQQKSFALDNFFIVGENIAYVRQLSAISLAMVNDKASIITYTEQGGTTLLQSQIMPSSKFKILYYAPNSKSYSQLAELSKKYEKGEPYSDVDIAMLEVFIENATNGFRCDQLKMETVPTNSVSNNSTIDGLPSVGKFMKTNKSAVIITGSLID